MSEAWPKSVVICLECGEVVNLSDPYDWDGGEMHGPTQRVSVYPAAERQAILDVIYRYPESRVYKELDAAGLLVGSEE